MPVLDDILHTGKNCFSTHYLNSLMTLYIVMEFLMIFWWCHDDLTTPTQQTKGKKKRWLHWYQTMVCFSKPIKNLMLLSTVSFARQSPSSGLMLNLYFDDKDSKWKSLVTWMLQELCALKRFYWLDISRGGIWAYQYGRLFITYIYFCKYRMARLILQN